MPEDQTGTYAKFGGIPSAVLRTRRRFSLEGVIFPDHFADMYVLSLELGTQEM
jgi:hypothetical protein